MFIMKDLLLADYIWIKRAQDGICALYVFVLTAWSGYYKKQAEI